MVADTYDVTFITPTRKEGFLLVDNLNSKGAGEDRVLKGSFGPVESTQEVIRSRDVPKMWDDVSAGMGYSQRYGNIQGYSFGKNVYTRSPRLIMPAAKLFPVLINGSLTYDNINSAGLQASIHWDGKLLVFGHSAILGISPGTPQVATSLAGIPGSVHSANTQFTKASIFRGSGSQVLYVADSDATSGGRLLRKTLGSTSGAGFWDRMGAGTPSNFTDLKQVYQAQGDKSGWQLYAVDGLVTGQAWHVSGDPFVAANWSGPVKVGSGYPIRRLLASNRHTYYLCDDGLYDLDENGYSPNLTETWKDYPNNLNAQAGMIYNGIALCSHALGLDYVPIGNTIRNDIGGWCQPGVGLPNETPVYGPTTACINEGGWAVISQWNGVDSYISYGKERKVLGIEGPGPMVWYTELYIPGEKVTGFCPDNQNGQNLMYVFTQVNGSSSCKIYCYTIPEGTPLQDFLNGGKHRFADSWEITLPSEDYDDTAAKKTLMRMDIQADGLGQLIQGSVSVTVDARTEEGIWISQGTSSASPRAIIFPSGIPSSNAPDAEVTVPPYLSGHRIQLRLSGNTVRVGDVLASLTYPAAIRGIKARAGMILEERETKVYHLKISGGTLRNGGIDKRNMKELQKWIFSLQNYGPILAIEDGETKVIKVESGVAYVETIHPRDGTATQEHVIEVTVSVLEQITPPEPESVSQYTGPTWAALSAVVATGTQPAWGDPGVVDANNDVVWVE